MQSSDESKGRLAVFSYRFDTAGRGPIFWGYVVLVPFLAAIVAWAIIAPLNAAAIATGEVILTNERKIVQHLEGGIIENILIREGEVIEQDQAILVIRDTTQRARMNTLYDQLASARALQARLVAERDGTSEPDFSGLKTDIDLPEAKFKTLKLTQQTLFNTRKEAKNTKIKLIEARKVAAGKQIEGLQAQLEAVHTQLRLANEELEIVTGLFEQQIATTQRKMETERTVAELKGDKGSLEADIARLEESILAADIEVIDLKTESQNAVLEQLQDVNLSVRELTHQKQESSDQLARTIVTAPSSGRVMDLQVHTNGAVIQPGERILDIVPSDDRLIVEARVKPADIDLVSEGVDVKVVLSAFKAKKVPKLDGEVINVTGDILLDEITGERHFLARVLVDDSVLEDLKAEVALYPGMPAEVFFIAGERTVADYLLSPVVDATYRAFREE